MTTTGNGAIAKERTTNQSDHLRQLLSLSLALEEACSARTAQQIKEIPSIGEQPELKGIHSCKATTRVSKRQVKICRRDRI